MLRSVGELKGFDILATDGEIGSVEDLYFDDEKWAIRYLVVNTGGWLAGRRVLLSPHALASPDWAGRKLPVRLTREKVEQSPGIDMEAPMSRREEAGYLGYYGWPVYWSGMGLWGGAVSPGGLPPAALGVYPGEVPTEPQPEGEQDDTHLHSVADVADYVVQARDGAIGHVEGFIGDDETWAIRYIAVDTGNWWPGKKVLVPPDFLNRTTWLPGEVLIDLDRETLRAAPEWDVETPITRDYEERLYAHYGRKGYWIDEERFRRAA